MDAREQDRPAIHVSLWPGTDPVHYRWVQIGAEEEGVPCRLVSDAAHDLVALAYKAAHSSRFNIGVAVSADAAVLHEMHMPPDKPVMSPDLAGRAEYTCRTMGANAARMVVRKPFRFVEDEGMLPSRRQPDPAAPSQAPAGPAAQAQPAYAGVSVDDPALLTALVALIVQKLDERGIR